MTSSREKRGAGDHRRRVRVVGPDRDGGDPGLPQLRLRIRRLRLRTLRLRSRDVNVPKTPRPERRPRLAASARRAQLVEVGRKVVAERGYDAKTAPIYAHALVGMVAFVGQWCTESRKPPPVETVASHIAALAWMGLRHLPKRPTLLATTARRS